MTVCARVRNFIFCCHARRDEAKRVTADIDVGDGLLDFRHVTVDAIAARRSSLVVRMLLDAGRVRPVRGAGSVTLQADHAGGLQEIGAIGSSMNVVAAKTRNPASVHHALNEVVALHSILVCSFVREVGEGSLAELVLFQLPVVG